MRKTLIALALFAALMVAAPRTASAHVGISIGLPGFGLAIGVPTPPVFVAPPVVYGPTYYAPAYPTYYGYGGYYRGYYGRPAYYGGHRGCYRGYRGGWRY
jgi:hypothetical protein